MALSDAQWKSQYERLLSYSYSLCRSKGLDEATAEDVASAELEHLISRGLSNWGVSQRRMVNAAEKVSRERKKKDELDTVGESFSDDSRRQISSQPVSGISQEELRKRFEDMLADRRTSTDWDAVNRFVCKLFDISDAEAELVNETVEFNGPYQSTRLPAAQPPADRDVSHFAACLEKSLQPFFKVVGQQVRVAVVPKVANDWISPWRIVTVLLGDESFELNPAFIAKLMRLAGDTSASRVVMAVPDGGLVLGLLNQRRFWTRSRARLCVLHLSRDYLEKNFPLPAVK